MFSFNNNLYSDELIHLILLDCFQAFKGLVAPGNTIFNRFEFNGFVSWYLTHLIKDIHLTSVNIIDIMV